MPALGTNQGTHTYAYTDLGQQERESHTAGPLAGWSVELQFDALARRSRIDVAENSVVDTSTHYTYDTAGRFRTIGDGTSTATYDHLANRPHVQHITYHNGTENVLRTDKTYDALDRLTLIQHDRLIGAMDTVSSYAYTTNNANQRTRVDEVDGSYWLYGYDSLGQVTSGISRPRASGGDSPPRASDGGNEASAKCQLAADGTPLPGHTFGYAYDDIGNRQTATTNGRTETYTANALNQYEQRTVPGAEDVLGTAASDAQVFVNQQPATRKDALWYGEVTADNSSAPAYPDVRVDAVKPGAGPNGEDVATTETGNAFIPETPEVYSYDSDGNMTSDGRWIYSWNGENRLIQLETDPAVWTAVNSTMKRQKFVFAYDHIGRRTAKEVYTWDTQSGDWALETSIRFIYDGWNLLVELEPDDYAVPISNFQFQVTRSYTWGTDLSGTLQGAGGVGGLLFADNADGTTMPLCDGNGNVMQYVDGGDGTINASYTYSPFGLTVASVGKVNSFSYRFSTKYTVQDGVIDYGLRLLAASTGRWLNRDPILESGGLNIFGFVGNRPTISIDQLGMFDFQEPDPPFMGEDLKGQFNAEYNIVIIASQPSYLTWLGAGGAFVHEQKYRHDDIHKNLDVNRLLAEGAIERDDYLLFSVMLKPASSAFAKEWIRTGHLNVWGMSKVLPDGSFGNNNENRYMRTSDSVDGENDGSSFFDYLGNNWLEGNSLDSNYWSHRTDYASSVKEYKELSVRFDASRYTHKLQVCDIVDENISGIKISIWANWLHYLKDESQLIKSFELRMEDSK